MLCLPGIVGWRLSSERRCWDCKRETERERGLGCALEGEISQTVQESRDGQGLPTRHCSDRY